MESFPPFIENIDIEGTWSGDITEPVRIDLVIDVTVKGSSHLRLIQKAHPSVLSVQITNITELVQGNKAAPTCSPRIRHSSQQHASDSPVPFSDNPTPITREYGPSVDPDGQLNELLIDLESDTQEKARLPSIPADQQQSAAELTEIPLFAQTASLYDATSSHDSTFSPTPLTSKKLTIAKRRSLEPDAFRTLNQHSPIKQAISRNECGSPRSLQKRPVSLDKRPPWRAVGAVGAEDTTQRGRRQLGTGGAQRRISRSVGTFHVERGRKRQRQSSLPGSSIEAKKGVPSTPAAVPQFNQTLPRGRLIRIPGPTDVRGRDTTVKVTRYGEALSASERLEKWLDDRRNQWHPEISSPNEIVPDRDGSLLMPSSDASSPALSPSPTPSSRAALPWTSVRGIRGGGLSDHAFAAKSGEAFIPTLRDDNGTLYADFQGATNAESRMGTFQIKILASIKLQAHDSGCHSLSIPGLPLQSGDSEGTFTLRVSGSSSCPNDDFKAYEKIAYVDDRFATHPLQDEQICHRFPLEKSLAINLLCFEAYRNLESSDFEIDSDVHTRYEWEDLESDSLGAAHSMICSLRLRPFLMWAENVRFKLYMIGGPSGNVETRLSPGNRRIYLDGNSCEAAHELEMSLVCPVEDLQKTFIVSWERSLGVAPFETWLPRISSLYPRKLVDIYDLPDENCVSITPRPCKKSRAYSMAAQDHFLKSSSRFFFYPENQLTPSVIQQSLGNRSGQFYDELTAEDPDYHAETVPSEDSTAAKSTFMRLEPNKRRSRQSKLLKHLLRDLNSPVIEAGEEEKIDAPNTPRTESKSIEAGPDAKKFLMTRGALLMVGILRRLLDQLIAPVRVLKYMVLIWLCFRAFDQAKVIQMEEAVTWNARAAWNSWNFEPVQLYDDMTGWKHLMARVSERAETFIRDGHSGGLPPKVQVLQAEERQEEADAIVATSDEVSTEEMSTAQDPMQVTGGDDGEFSSAAETGETGETGETDGAEMTLLDRIDFALGWKRPAGG